MISSLEADTLVDTKENDTFFSEKVFNSLLKTLAVHPQWHGMTGFVMNNEILNSNVSYEQFWDQEMSPEQENKFYESMIIMHAKYFVPAMAKKEDSRLIEAFDKKTEDYSPLEKVFFKLFNRKSFKKYSADRVEEVIHSAKRASLFVACNIANTSSGMKYDWNSTDSSFSTKEWLRGFSDYSIYAKELDKVLNIEGVREDVSDFFKVSANVALHSKDVLSNAERYCNSLGLFVNKKLKKQRDYLRYKCLNSLCKEISNTSTHNIDLPMEILSKKNWYA